MQLSVMVAYSLRVVASIARYGQWVLANVACIIGVAFRNTMLLTQVLGYVGFTLCGNYLFAYNVAQLNVQRVVNISLRTQLKLQTYVSTSPRLQSWVIDCVGGFRGITRRSNHWDGRRPSERKVKP